MTSGEGTYKIVKAKLAHQLDVAVKLPHRDGWHLHAIEPVLLDHGVTRRVDERQAITYLERLVKFELAKDVAGETGFATHHVFMGAITRFHAGRLPVDQQVQHVGLDGAVDYGQLLAVVEGVEHRHFKRGAHGDGRFAWFQVNLYTVLLGELL